MKLYGVKSAKDERILNVINLSKLIAMDIEVKKEHSVHLVIYLEDEKTYRIQFQSKIEAEHERYKIITDYLGFSHEYAIKVCGGNFENIPVVEACEVNRVSPVDFVHDIVTYT